MPPRRPGNPRSPGCSIYFEHPLHGPLEPKVYEAIAAYELHLRYYVQALRYAAFPYAHHTIGSSMAVRADAYAKQGGMNKRQAGEDFYFLHKIIPLGGQCCGCGDACGDCCPSGGCGNACCTPCCPAWDLSR